MPDLATPPFHQPAIPFAKQRSKARAAVGRAVGEALDHAAGLWRLSAARERPIQFYLGEEFLSANECAAMMQLIDNGSFPSPLFEKEKYAGVRTSQSCNLDPRDPLVAAVDARLAALLNLDPIHGEPLQGQRYAKGQEFKEHADFFYIDQPYWAEYAPHGGQRTWTAMIYLAAPESGGGTAFPLIDLEIEPRVGRILVWNNMALDGSPNPWTQHCGKPVGAGVKYIVTKWYREEPFR